MPRSQNAIFCGPEPAPDDDRIRGASLVRLLVAELPARGWLAGSYDCWRDCGWILPVTSGNEFLDLVLAPGSSPNSWILQIAATRFPFLLARWFGAAPSAAPDTVYKLAADSHAILSGAGLNDFRWRWDGPAHRPTDPINPPPATAR